MSSATEAAIYQSAAASVVEGDAEAALEELTAALQKHPDAGRLWELRGQAHLLLGEGVDAVNCQEHASCLVPLSSEGQLALGHAYELIDKLDLARDLFVVLADKERLPLVMLEPLARALGRANRPELALRVCTEAAARTPDSPSPLLGIVFYQRRLGFRAQRMLPVLFRAFHLEPEDFEIRLTLARMLHDCGRTHDAAELLSVVEIEASRCPRCLVAMQHIFEEVGDQANVARCLEALIACATEDEP